jgi:hypothetical protein
MLVPAFARFPEAARIIGRLLTGYSEIEFQLCACAGMGGRSVTQAIAKVYGNRGQKPRVKVANELGAAGYVSVGLQAEFHEAIEDVLHCLCIRNKFAHCIWHDDNSGKLAFADMEEIAAPTGPAPDPKNLAHYYLDTTVLGEQEAFFIYVKCNLNYLNYYRRQKLGEINRSAILRRCVKVPRPRLHL